MQTASSLDSKPAHSLKPFCPIGELMTGRSHLTLPIAGVLCLFLTLGQQLLPASALSESVCINTAATWVTSSPHLEGQFPFYSLMFFCEGDLNLENRHVDACINSGSNCGQPAADEFCQYLGFEGAAETLFTTQTADAPARSMTGEWCVSQGNYQELGYLNRTELESVNSTVTGPFCSRLDSVVCFNSRDRLAQNNQQLHMVSSPPSSPPPPADSGSSPPPPDTSSTAEVQLPPPTTVGGRRRLLTDSS